MGIKPHEMGYWSRHDWRLMLLMPDGTRTYIGEAYSSQVKALAAMARITIPAKGKLYAVRDVRTRERGDKR